MRRVYSLAKLLHVVVTLRGDESSARFLFGDLDEAGLKRKFLKPYRRGESILVGNDLIPLSEVTSVSIIETAESKEASLADLQKESSETVDRTNAALHESGVVIISAGSGWADEDIVQVGDDVTDRYIKAGPGRGADADYIRSIIVNPWVVTIIGGLMVAAIGWLFIG